MSAVTFSLFTIWFCSPQVNRKILPTAVLEIKMVATVLKIVSIDWILTLAARMLPRLARAAAILPTLSQQHKPLLALGN